MRKGAMQIAGRDLVRLVLFAVAALALIGLALAVFTDFPMNAILIGKVNEILRKIPVLDFTIPPVLP